MADTSANTTVEADSTSHGIESTEGALKKPKTYENRKINSAETSHNDMNITSSPCSDNSPATTSSPQNTSRYGRTRKPKITEDFYNTEDIFGPYERIPCSPVRTIKKKPASKLELSPNKSNEVVVTLDADVIKPDLDTVLSIDIPEETIEVSKVLKIVTNNTSDEFSPKSPSFTKPVKTYSGKREKQNSDSIYESFGLPDYPTGEKCPYVNGLSHSEESDSEADVIGGKVTNHSVVNSNSDSDKIKRTKFNLLSLKKNVKTPVKQLIQSDNISTSTSTVAINNRVLNHKNKHKLKVGKLLKNRFRLQKKPLPISRLKAKKLKPLKNKVSAQKIKSLSHSEDDESQMDKKKYETIDDLHKMYMPEVGDLTWSRVGSFPFWPSIVTKEPNSDRHTRTINFGKRITHFYHVNFFGDNGRRSWVLHTHIFPFHQRSDLEIMAKSVSKDAKPKEPRHLSAYIINPTKLVKWETAVTEAESLFQYPKEKRIKKFFEMVSPKKKTKKSPKKSQLKKKYFDDKNKNEPVDILIKEETKEDSLALEDASDSRNRRKNKKRKPSIVSEDSYTDSEKLEPLVKQESRDTPSPVLSSLVRQKKTNLFKGITRERVCQICGKNKDVFRCKGHCNGQYHIECDRKQRLRLPAACDEKTDFEMLIGENIVGKKDIKIEQESSEDVAANIVENLVRNVFAHVLPESDPSLSISEQIDLKMQEVMKNVVETNYTDSTTDYSSGSETESKTNSQNSEVSGRSSSQIGENFDETELSLCKASTKPTKKVIKHVTADGVFDIIQEEIEPEDHSNFKCTYCSTGYKPPCFICNKEKTKSGDVKKHKCMTNQCGKYYHAECLKDWPQTKWYLSTKRKEIDNENLTCPYHNCHTCISDDPRGPLSRMSHEKLAKCIRCPTTYHPKNHCIPAGTEILSNYQIICPKHLISTHVEQCEQNSKDKKTGTRKLMNHVNASWCFICSMGGSLICCETCPSSFHVECLKMTPPEGKYICEECESGRLPLYDEIVWVKLGSYRWWPAQILFPVEIPENVKNIAHNKGEFVVRFFGSHDHYWVNRGRVFLFQEGDTGHASSKKSAADRLFVKAIEEATKAHRKFVGERANIVEDSKNSMKPPSYIKIKVNKPVGDVRITDADTSNTTPCDCDPNWDQPCGPDSDCLNRILLTECNPMVCAAGSRCCNQAIQNRDYAHVEPFKTSGRGWGLRTLAPIKQGTFVIEYVGEVINETEYIRRMKRKHEQKDENYYFLTIDKDRMIDAGPKGNVARFMNHSCSPNCETQKWTVNGDTKVGLFAIKDIPEGAELTFNYNLECIGEEKKECRCGAPNCSGFIGVKAKQDDLLKKKKGKKTYKKKPQIQETKDFEVISCFVCGKTNAIQQCDREACNKFYHLECVHLETLQEGKWFCPWHSCNVCTKRTTRCCYMCTNSFCPLHSEGSIRYDRVKGFVCKEHDTPELNAIKTECNQDHVKLKKKKTKSIADEDLEEILKYDQTKSKNKSQKKNNLNKDGLKKRRPISAKSLANLKQYKHKMHLLKLDNLKTDNNTKTTDNIDEQKTEETRNPLTDTSKVVRVEKTNGLHPKIIIDTLETKESVNQNNNLAIKKRKSRMIKTSDSEDDDVPLSKRFKIDNESITENVEEKSPKNEEISSSTTNTEELEEKDSRQKKEEETKEINKLSSTTSAEELEEKDSKENKNKIETTNTEELEEKDSKQKKNKVETTNTEELDKKDSKQKKIQVEIKQMNKSSEAAKQMNNNTEIIVKRPRGRPRKYFPAPEKPDKEKEEETKRKQEIITIEENTEKLEIISSSTESESNRSQSQSSECDSENSTIDSIPEAAQFIDLECDAEEAIKTSVINKETLNVISLNVEKLNQQSYKTKSEIKRLKLNSPRPGVRKSLRISDPFDTSTSNVSNSEFEISIDLNSSQELEKHSTLLEEKRGPGRPRLSMKKKIVAVRKSSRFSNTEEPIKINETTEEIENVSIKQEDTSTSPSTTTENTSSTTLPNVPGEEPQKRKRGRPRKYFNQTPSSSSSSPIVSKKGRPKKIKLQEDSPNKQNTTVVEETTEVYKMKTAPFESHVNEIKLTTNVPERHLRVMLRKTEMETKAENKFLKMQNDIERDLPIRKRSKLRYETHL